MKRIALGILLSTLLGTAQAGMLTINDGSNMSFSGYNGEPKTVTGAQSNGSFGSLVATSAGTFYVTYLGQESSYINFFTLADAGLLLESDPLGKTISTHVGSGTVNFSFTDSKGATFSNGEAQTSVLGFSIFSQNTTNQYGAFDYILGFNDSFKGDADYDDFVVGVRFVAAPVPEAETYSMMLAGMGLIGFVTNRRREKKS
jgi:hypothetical protein